MTVAELISVLQQCDPGAKIELSDGSTLDDVCYNPVHMRVCVSTKYDRTAEDNLAEHWFYVEQTND